MQEASAQVRHCWRVGGGIGPFGKKDQPYLVNLSLFWAYRWRWVGHLARKGHLILGGQG